MYQNMGIQCDRIRHLSPAETMECCKKEAILVDVREEYRSHFKMFDVPDIIYLPFSEINSNYQELPSGKLLIFADAAGLNSKKAAAFVLEKGHRHIANMAGGLVEWERTSLPLKINIRRRLSGSCMCQLKPREHKNKT